MYFLNMWLQIPESWLFTRCMGLEPMELKTLNHWILKANQWTSPVWRSPRNRRDWGPFSMTFCRTKPSEVNVKKPVKEAGFWVLTEEGSKVWFWRGPCCLWNAFSDRPSLTTLTGSLERRRGESWRWRWPRERRCSSASIFTSGWKTRSLSTPSRMTPSPSRTCCKRNSAGSKWTKSSIQSEFNHFRNQWLQLQFFQQNMICSPFYSL